MGNKGWTEDESISYEGVSVEAPPPLEGFFRFEIAEAEPSETRTGKKAVKAKLAIVQDVKSGDAVKRTVYETVVVSKETAFRVLQLAGATGTNPPTGTGYEKLKVWCDELLDSQGGFCKLIRTKPDENGKIYSRVDAYLDEARLKAAMDPSSDAPAEEESSGRRSRRRS